MRASAAREPVSVVPLFPLNKSEKSLCKINMATRRQRAARVSEQTCFHSRRIGSSAMQTLSKWFASHEKGNLPFSYVLPLTKQREREMNNWEEQSYRMPFNSQGIGNTISKSTAVQKRNQADMLQDFHHLWKQAFINIYCFAKKSICLSFMHLLSQHSALCVTRSLQVWTESLSPWGQPVLHSPSHTSVTFCATCFVFGLTFDSGLSVTPAVPEDKGLVQCVKAPGPVSRRREQ